MKTKTKRVAKKSTSILLIFMLVFSLIPISMFTTNAASSTFYIANTAFTTTSNASGTGWSWNASTKTMTFNGTYQFTTTSTENYKKVALGLPAGSTIDVTAGSNITLRAYYGDAIYCEGALTIKGSGNLTAHGSYSGTKSNSGSGYEGDDLAAGNGITTVGTLTIDGPYVTAQSIDTTESAIGAYDSTYLNSGTLNVPIGKLWLGNKSLYVADKAQFIYGSNNFSYFTCRKTITYNLNGGTYNSSTANQTSTFTGSSSTLSSTIKPTKTGYTFLGWAKNATDTSALTNTTVTPADITYFYAVWKFNGFNLTYNLNGGKYNNSTNNVTVDNLSLNSTVKLLDDNDVTREDYAIDYWEAPDGTHYALGENITITGNLTLTAAYNHVNHTYKTPSWKWYRAGRPNEYTVVANTACEVCGHESGELVADVEYITQPSGYIIARATVSIGSQTFTKDITFEASYTLNVTNGDIILGAKDTYSFDDIVTVKATSKNAKNESFVGWYNSNDELITTDLLYSFFVRGNMDIYAKYSAAAVETPLVALSTTGGYRTKVNGVNKTAVSLSLRWDLTTSRNGHTYQVTEAGIIRSFTLKDNALVLNGSDVVKMTSSIKDSVGTYTYSATMSESTSKNKEFNLRGYVIYKDTATGETTTVYTNTFNNAKFVF